MNERKTSIFENGLIWFGAAVSIAEIMTGTAFAPLGFIKGLLAIIIGHIIGCCLLFAAGLIGGKTGKSSMETVKISFGIKGSYLFTILNIIQLVGWTAIMIYDGALAADSIKNLSGCSWQIIIGLLIIIWLIVGVKNLGKLNTLAMTALFLLTFYLCFLVLGIDNNSGVFLTEESISFGVAVELSVAMPLSWLPLISDYTKDAENPFKATLTSSITYGIVSCWMYIIGMGASIITSEYEISQILIKSGMGIIGLLIVILSTVTTTFLDAYSAGISSESLSEKLNSKWISVIAVLVSICAASVLPLYNITNFLYFIGSVFAPMIAIQIADFFILKHNSSHESINLLNLIIWLAGFLIYRLLMHFDIIVGSTLPSMMATIVFCLLANKMRKI